MLNRLTPGRFAGFLALIALALALVTTVMSYTSFVPGTDIDTYKNQLGAIGLSSTVLTLYNATLLIGCALISVRITGMHRRAMVIYWAGLVMVFLLLALEKLTNGNEVFFAVFRAWISQIDYFRDNWYWYTSMLFAGLFGLVLLALYLPFLLRLNRQTLLLFILGAVLFVAGSFGVDLLSTLLIQDNRYMEVSQQTALMVSGLNGLESFVETLSSVVFFYALLKYHLRRDSLVDSSVSRIRQDGVYS
ncbi:MAG: hypothetical protein H6671_07605 [Anaerolineaceae bacterium]|nr:hypothetical protein [Anaerolineaceae bacterium]